MNEQYCQSAKKLSFNLSSAIRSEEANKPEKAICHYNLALEAEQEMMPFFTDEKHKEKCMENQDLYSSCIERLTTRIQSPEYQKQFSSK